MLENIVPFPSITFITMPCSRPIRDAVLLLTEKIRSHGADGAKALWEHGLSCGRPDNMK